MVIILSKSKQAGGKTFIQICKDLNESLEINDLYQSFWYKLIGEVTLLKYVDSRIQFDNKQQ